MTERDRKLIKLLSAVEKEEPICRQIPDAFFPEDFGNASGERANAVRVAKAICRQCPLQQMCLDYAITAKEEFGIWGGTTAHERN